MTRHMRQISAGLFNEDFRLEQLSTVGDPLERIKPIIDWKVFRSILARAFEKERKGPGGRRRSISS